MYNLGNMGAMVALGIMSGLAGVGFGDQVLPEVGGPAPITINELVIRADGSTVYDRSAEGEPWVAWSGQIFKADGSVHCRGGALHQYAAPEARFTDKDVNWLVGDDCLDGLEKGMTFKFSWTPLDSTKRPVTYPEDGLGAIE